MPPSSDVSPPIPPLASHAPGLRGLYALADADACAVRGIEFEALARCFLAADLPLVQVRAKSWSTEAVGALARRLLPFVRPGTRLVLNDHLGLVRQLQREHPQHAPSLGLHVGQGDVPLAEVRRVAPDLFVGISTHDPIQVSAVVDGVRPHYLAYGPIFETSSKHNPEPRTGICSLVEIDKKLKDLEIPVVAIGGISSDSLARVASHCDLIASISMMLPPWGDGGRTPDNWEGETLARARALHEEICRTPRRGGTPAGVLSQQAGDVDARELLRGGYRQSRD